MIAEDMPTFSEDEAISVARDRYGLDVSVQSLVSERDQSLLMQAADGQKYVLKIANLSEPRDVTESQIKGRPCASIAILYWRASFRDPGGPYLEKALNSESGTEGFLAQLTAIPRENAMQTFRQVCVSVAC